MVLIMVMVKMIELTVSNTASVAAFALSAEFPCPSIIVSVSLSQIFWLNILPGAQPLWTGLSTMKAIILFLSLGASSFSL